MQDFSNFLSVHSPSCYVGAMTQPDCTNKWHSLCVELQGVFSAKSS